MRHFQAPFWFVSSWAGAAIYLVVKVTLPQLRLCLSLSLCPPPSFPSRSTRTLRTYPLPYDLEKRDTLQEREPGGWHWPHNSERVTVRGNKGRGCWPINVTFSSHCFLFENPSTCHSPPARLICGTSTFQTLRLPLCTCFTFFFHCYFQYYLSGKVRKLRVYVEWEVEEKVPKQWAHGDLGTSLCGNCVEIHSVPQSLMWAQKTVKGATSAVGICFPLPVPYLPTAPLSALLPFLDFSKKNKNKSCPQILIKAYWFYVSFL